MKAVWYQKNGQAREVLEYGELPKPEAGAGEVLVRLHTSGVNPSDVKSRAGRPLAFEKIIPHSDGAGVIEAVGAGVDATRIGQRVWIWNGQWQRACGTCAQYMAVPSKQTVDLPEQVSFEAGACLGIPALTAWQAVEHAGDLKDKTVLVIGAANAVGGYCVQLAKRKGARVIGTVGSEAKAKLARDLGADDTVNYKSDSCIDDIIKISGIGGVDVILDMDFSSVSRFVAGGVIKPHGLVVCYGSNDMISPTIDFRPWLFQSITLKFFLVYTLTDSQRQEALSGLSAVLQKNELKHVIAATFKLEDTALAHEVVEQGRVTGNVVIDLLLD